MIEAGAREVETAEGTRFERVTVFGSFPDTVVEVTFMTPDGERSRRYEVWSAFDESDAAGISALVYVDLMESF